MGFCRTLVSRERRSKRRERRERTHEGGLVVQLVDVFEEGRARAERVRGENCDKEVRLVRTLSACSDEKE